MHSAVRHRVWLRLVPAGTFLAILPLAHTVALRLTCLAAVLAIGLYARIRDDAPAVPCKPAIFAWAGIAVASLAWSVDRQYSLGEVVNEVGYAMAAFVGFYWLTRSTDDARVLLRVVVASAFCVSVFVIATSLSGSNWASGGRFGVGGVDAYSTWCVLVVPALMLAIGQRSLGVAPRWALWSTLVLVLASGSLTLNRAMWPAIAAAVLTWLALRWRPHAGDGQSRLGIVAAIVAVLALGSALFVMTNEVRRDRLAEMAPSVTRFLAGDPRFAIWSFAADRVRERPWQGHGFGRAVLRKQFREALGDRRYWDSHRLSGKLFMHTHNIFLGYAISVGLPGLAAFVWLLACAGWAHWRLARSGDMTARALGAFGMALLAAMIVRALADDVIVRDASLLFWSLNGIALRLGSARAPRPCAAQPVQR